MWSNRFSPLQVVVLGFFSICLSLPLIAGGYQVSEQSVRGLSLAHAGVATGLGDGSAIFYNPAALTRHDKNRISFGLQGIFLDAEFQDEGSTVAGVIPLSGDAGGNPTDTAVIPNGYAVYRINDKLVLGGSLNAPFGLAVKYEEGWIGRYHGVDSELGAINPNLTLGYKVNDTVSLGFGLNYYYLPDTLISSAIDFGTIGTSVLGPEQAAAIGLAPQSNDGSVTIEGEDKIFSFNAGMLFEFENSRFGIGYRHEGEGSVVGRAEIEIPAGYEALFQQFNDANGRPLFASSDGYVDITLPTIIFAGYHHDFGKLGMNLDVQWADWSVFPELRVVYSETLRVDSVVELEWEDAMRFSLGFDYEASETMTWRFGVAEEESPIPAARNRTPRIPDSDRTWLAGGFTYKMGHYEIDLAVSHIIADDGPVDLPGTTDQLRGTYDLSGNILSVAVNYIF
ncbi:OmpP1/FadL family transporter [Acanthopleuribacter pedis]|uniref:Outer membrane protein transport protein n=1 Tax=Acanthopleuribacter pedis TaxID=442870 RepID=A0A8J7QFN5_9BACT|nr:outer membrane protein transport protein [Acanthopleuribacter pedis]MBO1319661.1 outer membrane protein transport protein [Acanthopleuribacter pedis]